MKTKKIVIVQDLGLSQEQIKRLKKLGKTKFYHDTINSTKEWLRRCQNADIICSDFGGLQEGIYQLKDKFISLPFVNVGWIDKKKIKKNKVIVANSPGCNKEAVAEWIICMMLMLMRKFPKFIDNTKLDTSKFPEITKGLPGKNVAILGKGNVGTIVGKICQAMSMKVKYFTRGNNLLNSVKNAEVVINCLSSNPSTIGLLNKKFFNFLKNGSYFLSVTPPDVYDSKAMISALDKNLAGVADDCAKISVGDAKDPYFKRLAKHPKIIATPHIAFNTDVSAKVANDIMIANIEAHLKGKMINIYK